MKLFVIAAVLGACAAGRLDNTYLPPNQGGGFAGAGHSGFGGPAPSFNTQHSGNAYNAAPYQGGFGGASGGGASKSYEANAQILRYTNNNDGDNFNYDFETSNGIRAEASGHAANGVQERGSFGYKGDDGQDYSITYTADENGYRPQGAHLPTPPPIPAEILKSLEQNARDEAAGISDDGSYRGEGQGSGGYSAPSSNYGAPAQSYQAPRSQASFGGASRQYLAPHSAPRPSGNGNFNSQNGYQY